jgi:hypothetical protein
MFVDILGQRILARTSQKGVVQAEKSQSEGEEKAQSHMEALQQLPSQLVVI